MSGLAQDLRFAWRSFRVARGFTLSAILVLALTIAGVTAVFSLLDAALLRPRDFQPSDQLVIIRELRQQSGTPSSVSPLEFTEWRRSEAAAASFDRMAGFYSETATITGGREPERVRAARVSPGFFEVLNVPLRTGRTFRLDEERSGANDVAIISHTLWERYFGSSRLADQVLRLDGASIQVVGVARKGFGFPEGTHLWRPMPLEPSRLIPTHVLMVIARLNTTVDATAAEQQLEQINARVLQLGQNAANHRVRITTLHEAVLGELRTALVLLVVAVASVLLLASCSVTGVLAARAVQRQGEIAMKLSLGACRRRLIKQLLLEGAMLAVPAAALGILLGSIGLRLLLAVHAEALGGLTNVPLNTAAGGLAVLVSIVTGMLSSLLPALHSVRIDVAESLRGSGTNALGHRSHLMRHLLVSAQFAIAVVLTVSAGLLVKSFDKLRAVDPGFQTATVLVLETNLPAARYDGPRISQSYRAK